MKEHAAQVVSDEAFAKRAEKWSFDVPDTKEAYFIRDIFDSTNKYPHLLFWLMIQFFAIGLFPSETAAKTAVR